MRTTLTTLLVLLMTYFLSWDGSRLVNDGDRFNNNSVNFQFIPIFSLLSGLFNMGIIRRF